MIRASCIGTMNRLAHGARQCSGQRGTNRSSPGRCDALRLVFDTAALRKRFMESSQFFSNLLTAHEPACCAAARGATRQRAVFHHKWFMEPQAI